MRTICLFVIAAAIASGALLTTSVAGADEAQAQAAQAAKDPNYRFHNGQWWYWMPQGKHWMVWNGSQWNKYDASQAARGTRSFSYAPADSASYGASYSGFGDVSRNSPIIGSYGFRSAASKADGNY